MTEFRSCLPRYPYDTEEERKRRKEREEKIRKFIRESAEGTKLEAPAEAICLIHEIISGLEDHIVY